MKDAEKILMESEKLCGSGFLWRASGSAATHADFLRNTHCTAVRSAGR